MFFLCLTDIIDLSEEMFYKKTHQSPRPPLHAI